MPASRTDRRPVIAVGPAAPAATPHHGSPRQRPSPGAQRHPLDPAPGAPWRDLPARSGSHTTGRSRCRRWRDAGLLDQVLRSHPVLGGRTGGNQADDTGTYRKRPVIERTITRRTRFRRVATRYEKTACRSLAMVTIAMMLEWI